ncbi:TonB family protein [Altererythrobacter salegens]|uniref:TonB family protein n=1 Tax=Croceibacterium salegens TaxID=1737568 RepID=A0A6I4SW22_9SPHN|nr:energy transducer TonB [Croceibacterium salegens]MXO60191.1 TonB family protein [Croceibacterium salegens]
MSYLNQAQDPRRRATAIGIAIAVNGLIGYVLASGLVVDAFTKITQPTEATFIEDKKPPPPPPDDPQPETASKPEKLVAPAPPLDLTGTIRVDVKEFDPIAIPPPTLVKVPEVQPPVGPRFTPKRAAPRNDPARWVLNEDYPSRPIREEAEGVAGFRLVIGSDGKVDACEITSSSGNAELDAATCKYVTRRARFDAATDGNGDKVVGSYSSTVRWILPRR